MRRGEPLVTPELLGFRAFSKPPALLSVPPWVWRPDEVLAAFFLGFLCPLSLGAAFRCHLCVALDATPFPVGFKLGSVSGDLFL